MECIYLVPENHRGRPITLFLNKDLVLGRDQPLPAIRDKRISRKHCVLRYLGEIEGRRQMTIEHFGTNPSEILYKNPATKTVVSKRRVKRMGRIRAAYEGDTFLLIPGTYEYNLSATQPPFSFALPVTDVLSPLGVRPASIYVHGNSPVKRRKMSDSSATLILGENGAKAVIDLTQDKTEGELFGLFELESKCKKIQEILGDECPTLPALKRILQQAGGDLEHAVNIALTGSLDTDKVPLSFDSNYGGLMSGLRHSYSRGVYDVFDERGPWSNSPKHYFGNNFGDFCDGGRTFWLNALPGDSNALCKNKVDLSDLLTHNMEGGLLTTYKVDLEWLLSLCPVLSQVDWCLVHGHKDSQSMEEFNQVCNLRPNITISSPHLDSPYGTHHGKLMVLNYLRFVRVVVTTANLLSIDWEEKTQGVWVQDFPLKGEWQQQQCLFDDYENDYEGRSSGWDRSEGPAYPSNDGFAFRGLHQQMLPSATGTPLSTSGTSAASVRSCSFEDALVDYVKSLGDCGYLADSLRAYDFSGAAVELVTSVPGIHAGHKLHKYGHMRMRQLLRNVQLPPRFSSAPVIVQCSSVATFSKQWLFGEFFESFAACKTSDAGTSNKGNITNKDNVGSNTTERCMSERDRLRAARQCRLPVADISAPPGLCEHVASTSRSRALEGRTSESKQSAVFDEVSVGAAQASFSASSGTKGEKENKRDKEKEEGGGKDTTLADQKGKRTELAKQKGGQEEGKTTTDDNEGGGGTKSVIIVLSDDDADDNGNNSVNKTKAAPLKDKRKERHGRTSGVAESTEAATKTTTNGGAAETKAKGEVMTTKGGEGAGRGSVGFSNKVLFVDPSRGTTTNPLCPKNELAKRQKGLEIVWPTVAFVRQSYHGYASGRQLFLAQKNCKPFVVDALHTYQSTQDPGQHSSMTPHIKTYTRHVPGTGRLGWVLLTSANLSKPAWGQLNMKKHPEDESCWSLHLKSFEIGVLFTPRSGCHGTQRTATTERFSATCDPSVVTLDDFRGAASSSSAASGPDATTMTSTLPPSTLSSPTTPTRARRSTTVVSFPLPYAIPPAPYVPGDEPWVVDGRYEAPDNYQLGYDDRHTFAMELTWADNVD